MGRRNRDVRRGFTLPPQLGLSTVIDGLLHPSWTWKFMRAEPITFAHVGAGGPAVRKGAIAQADWTDSQFDPRVTWRDVEWLRSEWSGPIILKGVQRVDDATIAVGEGMDAIVLSNHGGRQLDSSSPSLELLPRVADAVGADIEIMCDGGVRS
jgi:L-lactate dehydrogenase (cytochrome)